MTLLAIDNILADPVTMPAAHASILGTSRQGRDILGYRLGTGRQQVSLIAGCHADEPVGPAMLDRLVSWLARQPEDAPCLSRVKWSVVPHVHPDGEANNFPWTHSCFTEPGARLDCLPDLASYLHHVQRDLPGDDLEFGFPRSVDDLEARPETRAVAEFLATDGAKHLHASFHGMAFAAGPWFLLEHSWADRTQTMRDGLRKQVRRMGYTVHDVDRGGEKGFHRIDRGFTSRPDSRAMVRHFETLGDHHTASLFRPSSMEYVRSLGGDPLTLVSEMPLFLAPTELYRAEDLVRPPDLADLRVLALRSPPDPRAVQQKAEELGVRPMPLGDQMRLQLEFLAAGLEAIAKA